MKEYPETHQQGIISLENMPNQALGCSTTIEGDFGIRVAEDGRAWVCINGIAFLRFKPAPTATEQKVYLCLEHCSFFRGEDGCGHNSVDDSARYEMEGNYPICPLYTED